MRLSRAGDTADLPTEQFLKFYVDEQVNAEDEARKNWEEAKAYERVPGGLIFIEGLVSGTVRI